jgi:hypothetical protein
VTTRTGYRYDRMPSFIDVSPRTMVGIALERDLFMRR